MAIDHLPIFLSIGFALAAYAYYVEHKLEESKQLGSKYTAACDIGIFSCTKVFSSEFGYMTQFFGLPKISNALVGMAFYAFVFMLHFATTLTSTKVRPSKKSFVATALSLPQPSLRGNLLALLFLISVASALGSCGLFVILTVFLHDLCIVCCSIYVVNAVYVVTAWRRYSRYVDRRVLLSYANKE